MQNGQPARLLKILTGPHRGAELSLSEGRTIIGTAEDCDIVLTDALMAPRHFELSVKGAKAEIRSLGGKLSLDQAEVGEAPKEVKDFQFITAGTTQIVLGPEGQAWPELSPPEPMKAAPKPAAAPAPSGSGEKPKEAASTPAPGPKAPMPRPVSLPSAQAGKSKPAPPSPEAKRRAWGWALVGVVLLILSVGAAKYLYPVDHPASLGVEEQITATLASLNLVPELNINNQGNRPVVSGYVKTNSQLTALRLALGKLPFPVTCRVYSEEKLVSETEAILSTYRLPLKTASLGKGTIRVQGTVADVEDWKNAKNLIEQDVAGIKQIENAVVTPEIVLAAAQELIARAGLQQAVTLDVDGEAIRARGEIANSSGETWTKTKDELAAKIAPSYQFRDEVVVRPKEPATPPATVAAPTEIQRILDSEIASVHISDLRWLVTTDGKVYFSGALLPNGFTVERIEKGEITFRRGTEVLTLNPKEINGK